MPPQGYPSMLDLPYGRTPYPLAFAGREATIVRPPSLPPAPPWRPLVDAALDEPISSSPIEHLLAGQAQPRVTIIISDGSRAEPRGVFLAAVRSRLPPGARVTIAIATGTHGPVAADQLSTVLDGHDLAGATLVNHDGHAAANIAELGTTSRGTPIRIHRSVLDADLVVATGCIRPHYFAGFGAGTKAFFPGLGEARAIRINHAMKTRPFARAGVVDGNPVREDLEEAFRAIPTRTFLLDGVCDADNTIRAVVAGDPLVAFRAGCDVARPWFTARAPRAQLVIASDALPVSASLYQAAKIAAAAAPLVADGGTLALVAECPDGTGPLDTVNEAIFRIGVLPRLPASSKLVLVSGLPRATVEQTLCSYAASAQDLIDDGTGPLTIIPRASQLILEPNP